MYAIRESLYELTQVLAAQVRLVNAYLNLHVSYQGNQQTKNQLFILCNNITDLYVRFCNVL